MSKRTLEDDKPLRVWTIGDLSEGVMIAIINVMTQVERAAYERVNKRLCKSAKFLWNQEKRINKNYPHDWMFKLMIKCPNLVVFYVPQEKLNWRPDPALFSQIQRFEGTIRLNFIVDYIRLNGSNRIEHIDVFIPTDTSVNDLKDMSSFKFEELDQLKSIKLLYYSASSAKHVKIIKKLVSVVQEVSTFGPFLHDVKPGTKLVRIKDTPQPIGNDFSTRYPNLEEYIEIRWRSSDRILAILNQLPSLKSVAFTIRDRSLRPQLQSFLGSKNQLTVIKIKTYGEMVPCLLEDIATHGPNIKHVKVFDKPVDYVHDIDWQLVMTMKRLRSLEIEFIIPNCIPDFNDFYNNLPKLKKLSLFTAQEVEYKKGTAAFLKQHPERWIETQFDRNY